MINHKERAELIKKAQFGDKRSLSCLDGSDSWKHIRDMKIYRG